MRQLLLMLSLWILVISSVLSQAYLPEKNNQKIKVKPAIDLKAYAFNLRDVRLLPGSPFKHAMDKDADYLLTLEPDRLLHRFHLNAGLPTKGEVYGGWESDGLSGHTLGHYLSACAMMFASTGDSRFKEKVDYVILELDRCQQDAKRFWQLYTFHAGLGVPAISVSARSLAHCYRSSAAPI